MLLTWTKKKKTLEKEQKKREKWMSSFLKVFIELNYGKVKIKLWIEKNEIYVWTKTKLI